jgi:hypothetical protein
VTLTLGDSTAQYYTTPPADSDVGRAEVHNLGGDEMGISAGIVVGYSPPEEYASYGGSEGLPLSIHDMRRLQQAQSEQQQHHHHQASYVTAVSPAIGTASELQIPHGQDTPSVPISTSSELAFALESKAPELVSNFLSL